MIRKLPNPIPAVGTVEELKEKLAKEGYKWEGRGAFASVWSKDGVAIKIAVEDEGYDVWLEECLNHQNNPYFPKIFDVKRFTGVRRTANSIYKTTATVVSMEQLADDEYLYDELGCGKKFGWRRKSQRPKNRTEREVFAALQRTESRRGFLDIHSGNILFRDKQPVITDPAA